MTELSISGFHIDSNVQFQYKSNPKRNGCMAFKRYQSYSQATNIEEYLELTKDTKFGKADLRYDVEHFHLSLVKDGVVLNEQPQPEPQQKSTKPTEIEDEFNTDEDTVLNEEFDELED